MHARAWSRLFVLVLVVLSLSCGGPDGPAVTRVRPGAVAPGGLLLLSGERLSGVTEGTLAGQPLTRVIAVNDGLLAATAPSDAPPGEQPLHLRDVTGQVVVRTVTVAGPSAPPAPAAAPAAAPAPQSSPAPASAPPDAPDPVRTPTGTSPSRAYPPASSTPVARPPDATSAPPGQSRPPKKDDKPEKDEDRDRKPEDKPGNGRGR